MFDALREFFRERIKHFVPSGKPPEPQLPLGLSRDHLEQIQSLTDTPGYKHYIGALESLYKNNLGAILRGLPHDAYMFQCGVCFALEQIAKLPADLTAKEKELDARHTARSTDISDADADAIFANTPFWDAYQRLHPRARQYRSAGVPLSGQ
jgi:hypothetical protein